jgi:hypothetical protein
MQDKFSNVKRLTSKELSDHQSLAIFVIFKAKNNGFEAYEHFEH